MTLTNIYRAKDCDTNMATYAKRAVEALIPRNITCLGDKPTQTFKWPPVCAERLPRRCRAGQTPTGRRVALCSVGSGGTMAQLIGRGGELRRALDVLRETAERGDGAVLIVTGEAGIGKTAMLGAIAEQAAGLGYTVGVGKADEIGQIAPGAPLLVALRSGLRPLLSADEFAGLAPWHSQPLWLVDRIADLLDEHAQTAPILLAVDDYQWADPLSRFALQVLSGRMAGLPVVWLLTSRGDARDVASAFSAAVSPAEGIVPVHAISLRPLSDDDIDAIATTILGRVPGAETRQRLRGAGGNPFLAVEYVGGLASTDSRALAAATVPVDTPAPPTLVAAVRGRLLGISRPAQTLVQLVALWGRPVHIADVRAVLAGSSHDAFADRVAEGVRADLLVERGPDLTIRHDLLRESIDAGTPAAVRTDLHRRIAERLLAVGYGALAAAPHIRASASIGDERAVTVLRAAAAECMPMLPEAAANLMGAAFALLPPGHPWWLDVGAEYAEVLSQSGHGSDVVAVVDTLLTEHGDLDVRARLQVTAARALWLAGLPAQILVRVDSTLSAGHVSPVLHTRLSGFRALAGTRLGTAQSASAAAGRVLAEARRLADRPAERVALQALGEVARNELRHQDALTHFRALRQTATDQYLAQETAALRLLDRFDEAQAVIDATSRTAEQDGHAVAPSLVEAQMWQDFMLGRFDDADVGARTLVRLSDELGAATYRLETSMVLILTAILRGDTAFAWARLEEAERDERSDSAVRTPRLMLIRSLLAALAGDPSQGVAIVRPVMAVASSTRSYWPRLPEWMRVHAGIAIAAGDSEFARETVGRAAVAAERNPGVASLDGLALQVRGLVDGDLEVLAKAVERLERSPRVMLRASALADYGSLLLARGERTLGIDALVSASAAYAGLGAAAQSAAVARTLRTAGVAVTPPALARRPDHGWAALTGAEMAVTEMIIAGHTNRGAARALGISPNTVATHLRSIFTKLDVRSRVQLSNAWHVRPPHLNG